MIFEIGKPLKQNPDEVYLVMPDYRYDAWELLYMLEDAFPNEKLRICCFNGYENCVAITTNRED